MICYRCANSHWFPGRGNEKGGENKRNNFPTPTLPQCVGQVNIVQPVILEKLPEKLVTHLVVSESVITKEREFSVLLRYKLDSSNNQSIRNFVNR